MKKRTRTFREYHLSKQEVETTLLGSIDEEDDQDKGHVEWNIDEHGALKGATIVFTEHKKGNKQ